MASVETQKKKHCSWLCAACSGQYDCRARNRILAPMQTKRKSNHLVNALKFLTNAQKIVMARLRVKTSLEVLRNFIEADNRNAVDVGGLRRGAKSFRVKKLLSSGAYREAVVKEGAELTL